MVQICKAYIEAINKGSLPNVENAWHYVCKSESDKALDQCENQIFTKLDFIFQNGPISNDNIEKIQLQVLFNNIIIFI